MLVVSEEILGDFKHLDAVEALQEEHVMDALSSLSICTNKLFQSMFEHLKQNADLNNLQILGTISEDAMPMEQIEAFLDKAMDTMTISALLKFGTVPQIPAHML